ncbi:MAG: hypothetical protein D8M57_04145 [Candidatus Scalindua sp. AMX11]|nr:MAG: hypothetical protein DWQ00_10550 [Candidatus Scalindua sp.]NOG82645.1 hypothetical protein [Planctomycetota bacterium]RZV95221.1 MAG: hypothetical protein EX341_02490 [Candidatus Scalindua sp. SCAELEC01]TDE66300.1 MAG: hypothetical protein D8M57_04145 [Candidatus Scalindua sp. AMX11]
MALSNDMDVVARPAYRPFGRVSNFERVVQDAPTRLLDTIPKLNENCPEIPIAKWFLEFLGWSLLEILIFRLNKTRGLVILSRGFCD